jgi:hypothetical protein
MALLNTCLLSDTAEMLRLIRSDDIPPGSLGDALMTVHDRWLAELRGVVQPIMGNVGDAAAHHTVLRRLDEMMTRWNDGERRLMKQVLPLLPPDPVRRLTRADVAIGRVYDDLKKFDTDSIDTAAPARELILDLLDALQLWCAEFELAAAILPAERLGDESRTLLARLS